MGIYARNIPIFTAWTQYTPVIPKQYWDVYSAEERIKWLCIEYDRVRNYLDTLADSQNGINAQLKDRMSELESTMNGLEIIVNDLVNQIDKIVETLPVYDPTQGKNVTSKIANRNMFRELAVFGARVDQMATLTTEQAAVTPCLEMAVIGNYTVFGNTEPRVTPIN